MPFYHIVVLSYTKLIQVTAIGDSLTIKTYVQSNEIYGKVFKTCSATVLNVFIIDQCYFLWISLCLA